MTYNYNPKEFNASDYTPQELHVILNDIITGECVPETKTSINITEENYRIERYEELKGELQDRAQDFQVHGYKFEQKQPTTFDW